MSARPVLDSGCCAAVHPAVTEAARRAGASAVGLVDVGSPGAGAVRVDRVGLTDGQRSWGDPGSPVQLLCTLRGGRPLPDAPLPAVVARVAVGRALLDVTDAAAVAALRARAEGDPRAEAELALALAAPPRLLHGEPGARLEEALALVPAGALPVVTTTWALSALQPPARLRLVDRLREAAAGRPLAWVSVEGVGVAPGVPTLGDRPASGHSTVGLALLDGGPVRAEAVARCWSRGRWLQWLAGPVGGQPG